MTVIVDAFRLERRRRKAVKARDTSDRHAYFGGVAAARFVLRKVFRLIEEEARRAGLDPLAHQALIQIYGSPARALRVKEIAERLDISAAFASSLVAMLAAAGHVVRQRDKTDRRVTWVTVTRHGRTLLHRIDEAVQTHVDYFTGTLTQAEREAAVSILMFYVGISLRPAPAPKSMRRIG